MHVELNIVFYFFCSPRINYRCGTKVKDHPLRGTLQKSENATNYIKAWSRDISNLNTIVKQLRNLKKPPHTKNVSTVAVTPCRLSCYGTEPIGG